MRERVNSGIRTGVMMLLCAAGGAFVVCRMAPFAATIYAACCLMGGSCLLLYVCAAGGIALGAFGLMGTPYIESGIMEHTGYMAVDVCRRYVLLLSCALCIMKIWDIRKKREDQRGRSGVDRSEGVLPIALAAVIVEAVFFDDGLAAGAVRGIIAGIVYVCAFYILKPGILAVTSRVSGGDWRREAGAAGYDTNQCIVSIMAIWALLLWLIPDDIVGGIAPSLIAALLMLLYVVYRSGASYGCGLAAAAGGILSVKTGNMGWIPWMLLVMVVMLIGRALSGHRRIPACIFYVLGAVLAAVAAGPGFICNVETGNALGDGSILRGYGAFDWSGLTTYDVIVCCVNLGLPVALFAAVPGSFLGRSADDISPACLQAAATEISRMTSSKMEDMANTFRRLDYTFAGSDDPGISLSQVGELVDGFRRQIERIGEAREVSDEKLLGQLRELGMEDVRVTEIMDDCGRNRFYVAGRTTGQGMVLSRQVAVTLSRYFGRNIRVGMNSPSLFFDDYRMAAYEESAVYRGMYHVRRIRKYGSPVSGDNFSVKEYEDGRLVMMLSDGMGSGSLASCESCMMLDTMEEMLEAGFSPEYSIAFANRCMAKKNQGRTFTTFDMVVIDMYDGSMTSFKQGASLTYVIHPGDKGNSVEVISSTTLPVGVLDEADCDVADISLSAGDAVVMVSDGISDLDTDGVMNRLLGDIHIGDSRKLVDEIVGRMLGQDDVSPRDDVTVMAAVIGKAEKSGAA